MEQSLLSILMIGFILGIKHGIEPDHIIAVSTIASHSKKLWRSSLAGLFWGIGHTATLLVAGFVLILFKNEIPKIWAMSLEFTVGIMLVYLGIAAILPYKKKKIHVHKHEHDGDQHKHFHSHQQSTEHNHEHKNILYFKSLFVGLVHGLAGSAAMAVLTMSTVKSVGEGILYILIFGAGTVSGMLIFTTIIGIPFVINAQKIRINKTLARVAGAVSTIYGFYYMYNLGVTEGLFRLWFQY